MGVWTGTPHDATAGAVLTAAQWDATVRDGFLAFGPMSSYTPTWTAATTNPVVNNGTLNGWYTQVQKTVLFRIQVTFGSTTTIGSGAYRFSLPNTAADFMSGAGGDLGGAVLHDTSASARRFRRLYLFNSSTISLSDDDGALVTHAVPWTWATGDSIWIRGWYEAA